MCQKPCYYELFLVVSDGVITIIIVNIINFNCPVGFLIY